LQYGYDQQSNRTYKQNLVNATHSELYTNDATGQLTNFQRGTLNSTKNGITGTVEREQIWNYDATGNWDTVETDGVEEVRDHNAQNEITSIGSTSLANDLNGNLTTDQHGHTLTFDAWNRLISDLNAGQTSVVSYQYDGLNRRVSEEHTDGSVRDFYHSVGDQVLEERVRDSEDNADSAVKQVRYVWSPVGSDILILRDRDTDANGTLDERLYVQQDANGNVTSITNTDGEVVQRFAYDPFGRSTVLADDFTATTDSYEWQYRHQGLYVDPTTGRVYNRARWLDVDLGRFISVDPLGFGAGDVNLRRYVGNGPVSAVDPSGMEPKEEERLLGMKPNWPLATGMLYFHTQRMTIAVPKDGKKDRASVELLADHLFSDLKQFRGFNSDFNKIASNRVMTVKDPNLGIERNFVAFKTKGKDGWLGWVVSGTALNSEHFVELVFDNDKREILAVTLENHILVGVRKWTVKIDNTDEKFWKIYIVTTAFDQRLNEAAETGFMMGGGKRYSEKDMEDIKNNWSDEKRRNTIGTFNGPKATELVWSQYFHGIKSSHAFEYGKLGFEYTYDSPISDLPNLIRDDRNQLKRNPFREELPELCDKAILFEAHSRRRSVFECS